MFDDSTDSTRNGACDDATCGRRRLLRAAAGIAVAGTLAGCTDDGNGDGPGADDGGDPDDLDDWFADTGNYDSVEDRTGRDEVTVEVGAQGNSGANAFAPAAVEISLGTTVTWEWVDGYHNVVATDGEFDSGSPERNATFEHAFENPGTVRYYCDPHESIGMKGAVVVAENGDEDEGEDAETASDES